VEVFIAVKPNSFRALEIEPPPVPDDSVLELDGTKLQDAAYQTFKLKAIIVDIIAPIRVKNNRNFHFLKSTLKK
jgi:hypothetical protein